MYYSNRETITQHFCHILRTIICCRKLSIDVLMMWIMNRFKIKHYDSDLEFWRELEVSSRTLEQEQCDLFPLFQLKLLQYHSVQAVIDLLTFWGDLRALHCSSWRLLEIKACTSFCVSREERNILTFLAMFIFCDGEIRAESVTHTFLAFGVMSELFFSLFTVCLLANAITLELYYTYVVWVFICKSKGVQHRVNTLILMIRGESHCYRNIGNMLMGYSELTNVKKYRPIESATGKNSYWFIDFNTD